MEKLEIETFEINYTDDTTTIEVVYFWNNTNPDEESQIAEFEVTDNDILTALEGVEDYWVFQEAKEHGFLPESFKEHATEYDIKKIMTEIYFPNLKGI